MLEIKRRGLSRDIGLGLSRDVMGFLVSGMRRNPSTWARSFYIYLRSTEELLYPRSKLSTCEGFSCDPWIRNTNNLQRSKECRSWAPFIVKSVPIPPSDPCLSNYILCATRRVPETYSSILQSWRLSRSLAFVRLHCSIIPSSFYLPRSPLTITHQPRHRRSRIQPNHLPTLHPKPLPPIPNLDYFNATSHLTFPVDPDECQNGGHDAQASPDTRRSPAVSESQGTGMTAGARSCWQRRTRRSGRC